MEISTAAYYYTSCHCCTCVLSGCDSARFQRSNNGRSKYDIYSNPPCSTGIRIVHLRTLKLTMAFFKICITVIPQNIRKITVEIPSLISTSSPIVHFDRANHEGQVRHKGEHGVAIVCVCPKFHIISGVLNLG